MTLFRPLFGAALLTSLACGGGGDAGMGVELRISALRASALEDVESFQIAVIDQSQGTVDCGAVTTTCLKSGSGYKVSALVPISGADGKTQRALQVPSQLESSGGDQAVVVRGIPPGNNYAVVIEAVSKTHQFLGSFCGYQQRINSGTNAPSFVASLTLLSTPIACDPRIP